MKISIVVPIYNVEKELERCIESLINQTYKDIEIILVDDGSKDNCPMICDKYMAKDNRIKVIHKENGGLSDARNTGINNSTGDYILFVDSDDYILLDTCEKFAFHITYNVDIIVGEAKLIYERKEEHQKHNALKEDVIYTNKEYIIASINNNEFYAPICYNLYKKSFLTSNNLYFKKGILHEDMEILLKLFLSAKKINCMKYEFYQYVIRENSINNKKKDFSKNIEDSFEIYKQWKIDIEKIKDKELTKKLNGVLSKYVITTCRRFKVSSILPDGIDFHFLLRNTLNIKEFVKTLFFVCFRKIYVNL
ncbi:MAG: glycosyltransferase [Clostridia bacterium]|nr:glycosyltransferase [Clostridia bacterium]